jgi:hypothetical protein
MEVASSPYVPELIEHVPAPDVIYLNYGRSKYCRAERAGTLFSMTGAHPTPVYYLTPVHKDDGGPLFVIPVLNEPHLRSYAKELMSAANYTPAQIAHCAWVSDHFRALALVQLTAEMDRLIGWVKSEAARGLLFDAKAQTLRNADSSIGLLIQEDPPVYERVHPETPEERQDDGTLIIHTQTRIDVQDAPQGNVARSGNGGVLDDYGQSQKWERYFPGQLWQDSQRTRPSWMDFEGASVKYRPEYELHLQAARRIQDLLGVANFPAWPTQEEA